jgi:hypothetical protein
MSKKPPLKTICIKLPEPWVKLIDDRALRECVSRTAIIKSWIKDICIKGN